jgi:sulfur-oxidizing protein SoxA
VQDLESRLLTCMEKLQGFNATEIAATPFGKGEQVTLEALAAWISAESRGMKIAVPQGHAEERRYYELGKRAFFYRGGPMDFSCASCHGEDGKRIRLQDLPNLTKNPGDGVGFAAWPAYRVSSGEMWSMQRRLNDCFRQQRFPYPGFASDVTIALGVFMGVNAKGAESIAPAIKR